MSKFCYTKSSPLFGASGLYGISPKGKQWGVSDVIDIAWIHGTKEEREAVKKYASVWFEHANLSVRWDVPIEKSDVRISFMKGQGSWSYVGVDCLNISKEEPTMNFGWDITNDPGTVRHEFGHLLSMLHPHTREDKDFEFIKNVIYKELAGPPNYWSKIKVDRQVFDQVHLDDHYYTDFDRKSVMIYSFPNNWVRGKGIKKNHNLSKLDIEMIKKLYPHTD